jgi:ankyrin repeat protein
MLHYLGNSCFYRNFRKEEMIALFLVSQGASVNDVDKHNKSIAHQASYSGMNTLLRRVLEKGCDPNKQVKPFEQVTILVIYLSFYVFGLHLEFS